MKQGNSINSELFIDVFCWIIGKNWLGEKICSFLLIINVVAISVTFIQCSIESNTIQSPHMQKKKTEMQSQWIIFEIGMGDLFYGYLLSLDLSGICYVKYFISIAQMEKIRHKEGKLLGTAAHWQHQIKTEHSDSLKIGQPMDSGASLKQQLFLSCDASLTEQLLKIFRWKKMYFYSLHNLRCSCYHSGI